MPANPDDRLLHSPSRRRSHPANQQQIFQFISVDPNSYQASRRNNQLVHAHLAKARERDRNHDDRVVPKVRRMSVPMASAAYTDLGQPQELKHAGSDCSVEPPSEEPSGCIDSTSGTTSRFQLDKFRPRHRFTTALSNRPTEQDQSEDPLEEFLQSQERQLPMRTLSPVLGAMQNCTLECASPSILAQTIDTKLNLTFPKYSKPFDITSRLKLFYEEPIVFHGFTVASAVHRDILRNEPALSRNQEIIAHHSKLLHLLNSLLNNLEDGDIELAILAILLLTLADLDCFQLGRDIILPFRPHMASANWINVFGRVMSLDETRFNEHIRAMELLAIRRGGIEHLRLPGLGVQVGYQDLIGASRMAAKPRFPCIWQFEDSVLTAIRKLQTPSFGRGLPGRGFRALPIPSEAIGCYIVLSSVDNLLAGCQLAGNIDFTDLVNARNTVQHQTLSLGPWNTLIGNEAGSTFGPVYECCRLTAVLYSTAIVFGMPPHTRWHFKLVRRIKKILLEAEYGTWEPHLSAFTIWVLFVCGIAAYRSPERVFFERALMNTLPHQHLHNWKAVERILSTFLWSEPACEHGAAVLWDSLWSPLDLSEQLRSGMSV